MRKPLELRKIDKSPAAEQFVYSAARLRANELEHITYSRMVSRRPRSSRNPLVDDPSPSLSSPRARALSAPPTLPRSRGRRRQLPSTRVRTCLLYPFAARRPILSRVGNF